MNTIVNANPIVLGKGEQTQYLIPAFGNRHGLISGATGTGKTVTLQVLTEGFARIGVPVFVSDIKGDLAGLSQPATFTSKLIERAAKIGVDNFTPTQWSVIFWDIFGRDGHPLRTTIGEMGPLLLSNLLELNETQEGVLNIAFRVADEQGLLLIDFDDLKNLLRYVANNATKLSMEYGNITLSSVASIQRRLLVLDEQGAENFFGEPALSLSDMIRTDEQGHGMINILAADKLIHKPKLYATFLLWLLTKLWEEMPEVGDPSKPALVLFFDEAHLLFNQAPRALLNKIEQIVRLIRSKGVGVFFVTQNPLDIPDAVLGQLGNRIQHALRAFTVRDQRAVRAAAETFCINPNMDVEKAFMQMGVGEALVSTLQMGGIPGVVDRCLISPPTSRIGSITDEERAAVRMRSPIGVNYDTLMHRVSASEILIEQLKAA